VRPELETEVGRVYRHGGPPSGTELGEGDRRTMATLIRGSRWLGGAVLLIISAVWGQSRGTSEDEPAVRALIQGADGDDKNATQARQYGVDADWTNSFGERLHGREALLQKFDQLAHSAFYQAGRDAPGSHKVDVRFVRPDVAVVYEYEEVVGQIDPTIGKPMPPRKIHHQYVVSKDDSKWLIQSELIMMKNPSQNRNSNNGEPGRDPVTSLNHTPERTAGRHTLHSSVRH
jgi:uncharacterized protein (TIGR02246 family)